MLTMHKDENIVRQIFELGAKGYLLKNAGTEEILKAIETVMRGERFFCNEIAQMLFMDNIRIKQNQKKVQLEDQLSIREIEILVLICKEMSSKEIADKLNVSTRTVEWHRNRMIDKLNVKSSIGLVKYAIQHGFDA